MTGPDDYAAIVSLLAPSLVTAGAVGCGGGVVGTFVLLRREALLALALPQAVAVGAAIGLRLGWPTVAPALVTAALTVVLLCWSKRRGADAWMLPAVYIAGLSLSFLVIAGSGAHVAEMQNLFTGIDVAVAPALAAVAAPTILAAGLVCALLWRRWLLLAQMPASAELAGLHPARWDALFITLMAVVLLMGTSALGVVMVVAMLFLPAATAQPWARRVPGAMVGAAIASLAFLAIGLIASVEMSWPLSQSVAACGFVVCCASHGLSYLRR